MWVKFVDQGVGAPLPCFIFYPPSLLPPSHLFPFFLLNPGFRAALAASAALDAAASAVSFEAASAIIALRLIEVWKAYCWLCGVVWGVTLNPAE